MPPKARITKDMIIDAGVKTVRTEGADSLNVRRVAAILECSTQPVMYHFKTVKDLKNAVYEAANSLHAEYIMLPDVDAESPFMSIGLRYIQFAKDEKYLFRFLFQSNKFQNVGLMDIMNADDLLPIIAPLCENTNIPEPQVRTAFETMFICVHGIASLIANNAITYDKEHFKKMLVMLFDSIIAKLGGQIL